MHKINLVGKLEGKEPVARHKRRWKDSISIHLRETGWDLADFIHLTEDRDQERTL